MSLVRGGPLHRLQGRLGLLADDGLPTVRAAIVVAAAAWLPLAALAAIDPRSWALELGSSLFTDLGAYARFLVAAFMLIVTDRMTDHRLNRLLASLEESGIIGRETRGDFFALVVTADRRTSSGPGELVMLLGALAVAAVSTVHSLQINPHGWIGASAGMPGPLSPAGWWYLLVSLPLFVFLVFRWLWRFAVWTALLRSIAVLPLQLVPTHPDRTGGLGFLALFPAMFVPLAFSLSTVVAAQALQEVLFAGVTFEELRAAALAWAVLVLVIFIGPLTVFSGQLMRLKERAVLDYGEVVACYNRQAERQMYADDARGQVLDASTISAVADIAAGLNTVYSIKILPIQSWSVIPLLLSAILPMLAVAAVQVPIGTLVRRMLGAIL